MRISWSIGATTHSYLKCIVYDKLLKPRQSFLITLYTEGVGEQDAEGNVWTAEGGSDKRV